MKENLSIKANLKNHPSMESKFRPQKPSIKVDYKVISSSRVNEQGGRKKYGKKLFSEKITSQNCLQTKQLNVVTFLEPSSHGSRVKSVQGRIKQYESGKFIQSQYCTNDQSRMKETRVIFHKAKVADATSKYQQSKSVQTIIKEQYAHPKRAPSCFGSKSRTQKEMTQTSASVAPDYISKIKSSKLSIQTSRTGVSDKTKLPSYSNEGIKDIIEYEHAGKYREEKVTPKCGVVQNDRTVKDRFRAFNQINDFDFRKRVNTLSNQFRLTKGLR